MQVHQVRQIIYKDGSKKWLLIFSQPTNILTVVMNPKSRLSGGFEITQKQASWLVAMYGLLPESREEGGKLITDYNPTQSSDMRDFENAELKKSLKAYRNAVGYLFHFLEDTEDESEAKKYLDEIIGPYRKKK